MKSTEKSLNEQDLSMYIILPQFFKAFDFSKTKPTTKLLTTDIETSTGIKTVYGNGVPGWLSWFSTRLLISAQVMISQFVSSAPPQALL